MSIQQRRLARACLLIGAGFAALALWNPVVQNAGIAQGAVPTFSGRALMGQVLTLEQERDASVVSAELDAVEAHGARSPSEAPAWFEEEVVSLEAVRNLHANDDWSVVGFVLDGQSASALAWMKEQLEGRSWSLVESGVAGTLTGTKEGGRCSWLLFSCTEIGKETCVVVQVPAA